MTSPGLRPDRVIFRAAAGWSLGWVKFRLLEDPGCQSGRESVASRLRMTPRFDQLASYARVLQYVISCSWRDQAHKAPVS